MTTRVVTYAMTAAVAFAIGSWPFVSAGATSRSSITATTTGSGGVLLVLGAAVLVLGGAGFVVFTWTRRKRRPSQCAEQRAALELAERSVQYWEAARAHLEAVERAVAGTSDATGDDVSHATLMTNAVDGLRAAIQQRDQCQLDLIHCMASGVPAVPVIPTQPTASQPFFIPGSDDASSAPPTSD